MQIIPHKTATVVRSAWFPFSCVHLEASKQEKKKDGRDFMTLWNTGQEDGWAAYLHHVLRFVFRFLFLASFMAPKCIQHILEFIWLTIQRVPPNFPSFIS